MCEWILCVRALRQVNAAYVNWVVLVCNAAGGAIALLHWLLRYQRFYGSLIFRLYNDYGLVVFLVVRACCLGRERKITLRWLQWVTVLAVFPGKLADRRRELFGGYPAAG